ncbi:hypothetical protein BJ912DRAFT_1025069 [Pholiota molesta]|nr:hypothetical protein BJ912DRAFT_1025069 [Pholiota molesta]
MNATLYIAAISIFLLLLLLLTRTCQSSAVTNLNKATHDHLIRNIKNILHPDGSSLQTLLTERAHANKRLIRALALSNTFVSEDRDIHAAFVTRARRLLSHTQRNGWAHFQSIARDAIHWQLQSADAHSIKNTEYSFDGVIQNITLYVVLQGILQIDNVAASSYEDIDVVASSITKLWALSKKTEPIPPHLLEELTIRLRRLVPDEEEFPAPLNFIVPTWETLWRVVATTVAYSHDSDEIQQAFQTFNACPKDDTAVNVRGVVTEALRLNPPSKRIGRRRPPLVPAFLAAWVPQTIVKADVEALLHCGIWGADAKAFLPGDGVRVRHGPLRCIAASWAPVAAAVIAGVVLEEYAILPGKNIGEREGWVGWRLKKRMQACR